jgi:hypothetical protein
MTYQENKGRLLPEAPYRIEDAQLHLIREAQDKGLNSGDARQHTPSASQLARRLEVIDPQGLVSHALAAEVEKDSGVRK